MCFKINIVHNFQIQRGVQPVPGPRVHERHRPRSLGRVLPLQLQQRPGVALDTRHPGETQRGKVGNSTRESTHKLCFKVGQLKSKIVNLSQLGFYLMESEIINLILNYM